MCLGINMKYIILKTKVELVVVFLHYKLELSKTRK